MNDFYLQIIWWLQDDLVVFLGWGRIDVGNGGVDDVTVIATADESVCCNSYFHLPTGWAVEGQFSFARPGSPTRNPRI